jgi:AbrB family looped-hinge helix DNA binding protein
MVETTTISTKGQLTIPAQIREQLGLEPGTKVRFLVDDDGSLVLFPIQGKLDDLFGILPKPGKRLTIKEMKATVEKAAVARAKRGARS